MEFVYQGYVHALRIQRQVVIESLREKMPRLALFIYSFKKKNLTNGIVRRLQIRAGQGRRGKEKR